MKRPYKSLTDQALAKLVAKYEAEGNPFASFAALSEAIAAMMASPDREFERASRSLDPEEFQRYLAELVQRRVDAHVGRRVREKGENSPGRRGKHRVTPEELLAAVQELHARSPQRTFNDICSAVAKKKGYKSAWPVKKAAAQIKWTRPN